jgi:hypothetical protein
MRIRKGLFWRHLSLSEGLWLGFCATFIIVTKAFLRLHLHLTGHAMFFTMFFFLLGKGAVPKRGAATLVGLVAGILGLMLGMGKEGPLIILRYMLAGFVIDAACAIYPRVLETSLGCALVAAIASTSRAVTLILVEWLAGMETVLIMQHAAIGSVMNILFGVLGSLMVPPIIRRLKAAGLVT